MSSTNLLVVPSCPKSLSHSTNGIYLYPTRGIRLHPTRGVCLHPTRGVCSYPTRGVRLHITRGVQTLPLRTITIRRTHVASTVNNLTEGWKPKYPIYLFHSKADEVVPLSNAESAYQKMRTDANPDIVKYTYVNKGGHVESGKTFYFALFGKCYEQLGVEAIAGGEEAWKKFKP